MMNSIMHEELYGGYTGRNKIIIDAAFIYGEYEIIAMTEDGNELNSAIAATETAAVATFRKFFQRHAAPFQKALYSAGLIPGHRYTLVYLDEFGFPVAQKITFDSMSCTTYAQHGDVVKMVFRPFRKRALHTQLFYNKSLFIYDGWQDLDEKLIYETVREDKAIKLTRTKYACFSASYMDDLENAFTDPVLLYKDYKQGANGKLYA